MAFIFPQQHEQIINEVRRALITIGVPPDRILCNRHVTDKTGFLIGVKAVTDEHEIMMINSAGIIIQIRACDFKNIGRITSGVKMMNLDEGIKVVKIAKVRSSEEEEIEETVEDVEDTSEKNSEE